MPNPKVCDILQATRVVCQSQKRMKSIQLGILFERSYITYERNTKRRLVESSSTIKRLSRSQSSFFKDSQENKPLLQNLQGLEI